MRRSSDDLPAFGRPTRAASASSLRCSSTSRSSPGSPTSANRGTCRVDETKRALPRPPRPPCASTTRAPACTRSATTSPSSDNTCVPTGTRNSVSWPRAPCLRALRPLPPRAALIQRRRWSADRSRRSGSATRTTSPPSPPSPPSGPPFGTNFSRRKLSPPSPPLPAARWMCARSLNIELTDPVRAANQARRSLDDGDCAALAARAERDRARTRGEDRVVAAELGAGAGAELRAALADDDVARLDGLPVEHLHSEVLRVGVAAVLRGAEALLVCHFATPPSPSEPTRAPRPHPFGQRAPARARALLRAHRAPTSSRRRRSAPP